MSETKTKKVVAKAKSEKTSKSKRARKSGEPWFVSSNGSGKATGPFETTTEALESLAKKHPKYKSNFVWAKTGYVGPGAYRLVVKQKGGDEPLRFQLYTKTGQSVFEKKSASK